MLDTDCLLAVVSDTAKGDRLAWMSELLSGYVTSADTGNETLVIASRAALCKFCEESSENLDLVAAALMRNLRQHQGQDRVLVPTLEIVSLLLNLGLLQQTTEVDIRTLALLTQKSGYKSSNVRKLETCIKVYGAISRLSQQRDNGNGTCEIKARRVEEGVAEAKKRLGALMFHPWPRVKTWVVDELWTIFGDGQSDEEGVDSVGVQLKGVDWGTAQKDVVRRAVEKLGVAVS